jgi:hypothetical protein
VPLYGVSILVQKWTLEESRKSSAWRELKSIVLFLSVHAKLLSNRSLLVYTDNQSVVHIARKSSMVVDLHILAKELFELCLEHAISLTITWIPRDLNSTADDLSKHIDRDDWSVDPKIFSLVQLKLGEVFTFDAFAATENALCKQFYSRFWCKDSSGVGALYFDWSEEFVWLVPPICLVAQALKHAQYCKSAGVVVIPVWRSAAFWPFVHDGSSWKYEIFKILEYRRPTGFFRAGPDSNDVFTENSFNGDVLVLGFNFRE